MTRELVLSLAAEGLRVNWGSYRLVREERKEGEEEEEKIEGPQNKNPAFYMCYSLSRDARSRAHMYCCSSSIVEMPSDNWVISVSNGVMCSGK